MIHRHIGQSVFWGMPVVEVTQNTLYVEFYWFEVGSRFFQGLESRIRLPAGFQSPCIGPSGDKVCGPGNSCGPVAPALLLKGEFEQQQLLQQQQHAGGDGCQKSFLVVGWNASHPHSRPPLPTPAFC